MPYYNETERAAGQLLFRSINQGDEHMALQILSTGEPIDLEQTGVDATNLNQGCTSLMQAARCGFNSIIRALLQRGACVTAVDFHGCTALMYAARNAQTLAVHMLLHLNAADATPVMRRVEFLCTIGRLMTLVPQQSVRHAACVLMILDSVRSHSAGMWQFFPDTLQQLLRQLQALVFSVTSTVQTRSLAEFLGRERLLRAKQRPGVASRALGLMMAEGGLAFGNSAKKCMVMNASMLRKLLLR